MDKTKTRPIGRPHGEKPSDSTKSFTDFKCAETASSRFLSIGPRVRLQTVVVWNAWFGTQLIFYHISYIHLFQLQPHATVQGTSYDTSGDKWNTQPSHAEAACLPMGVTDDRHVQTGQVLKTIKQVLGSVSFSVLRLYISLCVSLSSAFSFTAYSGKSANICWKSSNFGECHRRHPSLLL